MARLPSTYKNGLNKINGKAKFGPRNADGSLQSLIGLGPAAELSFNVSSEQSSYTSREDSNGETLDSQVDKIDRVFTITVNRMHRELMAMFLSGTLTTIAQASGTVTEEITPHAFPNRSIQLGGAINSGAGAFGASAATLSSYEGLNASAWVTATTYAVGDVVIPTVANAHWYMATAITTGTSGGSEPTWSTSGGAVTDSGVTWQDMGVIEYVANTDYELDAEYAMVNILDTGAIAAAVALVPASLRAEGTTFRLSADYTRAAKSFEQIATGASASNEGEFRFYEENAKGENNRWWVPSATLVPNGDYSLKTGADYGSMSFTVTAIKLPTKESLYVNEVPA